MTYRWLLDVDGVLNANNPGWSEQPIQRSAFAGGTSWKLRFSPSLIARIKRVYKNTDVEMMWATTWCPWADQLERMFGFKEFQRAYTDDKYGDAARAAKFAAAQKTLQEGHNLIWTDDEAISWEMEKYIENLYPNKYLIIRPKPNRGLQPEHLDTIENFINKELA